MKIYTFKIYFYGIDMDVFVFANTGADAINQAIIASELSAGEIDNIVCTGIY